MQVQSEINYWDEHLPNIFTDKRFTHTSPRKYQFPLNGEVAGIVLAVKPGNQPNYGLNKPDFERLLEFLCNGSFADAFVVFSSGWTRYNGHRDAEELYDILKDVPPRSGPYGDYWLLNESFSPVDAATHIPPVPGF
jgi:hypothetical protein